MIERKTYLPFAAVAALGLALYGCGGGDGPATGGTTPDPAAVAEVIDFTANWAGVQDENGVEIGSWRYHSGLQGDYSTTSLAYRDGAPAQLVASNDDNGDLQLNIYTFEFTEAGPDLDEPVAVNFRRYASTYEGARDYTDRVTLRRTVLEEGASEDGQEIAWRVEELTNDYKDGGTFKAVIATDLERGATAIDPFEIAEEFAHDIVLDDLHEIIPAGYDFATAILASTDDPLRGSLDGQPGEFSCSVDECLLTDELTEGNYYTSRPGLVFTPDDGSGAIDIAPAMWGYAPAADYLAFGYWLYVPEDATDTDAYEFGTFGSVGDLFDMANVRGLEDEAEYMGDATGMYFVDGLSDSPSTGYFTAKVELTANFGTSNDVGSIGGKVDELKFEDDTHASSFPEMIDLKDSPNYGVADAFMIARDTTNIFDTAWPTGWNPGAFAQGWTYANPESSEWFGSWWGQFHGNGAASTDHPTGVAGVFGSYLAAFDSNGVFVPGPADRGLAGGFAARQPVDQQ